MRFVNAVIGMVLIIVVLILYFQSLIWGKVTAPFFNQNIWLSNFIIIFFILSFFAGVFLTLAIKGILNKENKYWDEFDL